MKKRFSKTLQRFAVMRIQVVLVACLLPSGSASSVPGATNDLHGLREPGTFGRVCHNHL